LIIYIGTLWHNFEITLIISSYASQSLSVGKMRQ